MQLVPARSRLEATCHLSEVLTKENIITRAPSKIARGSFRRHFAAVLLSKKENRWKGEHDNGVRHPVTVELPPQEKRKQRPRVWWWKVKVPGEKMVAKVFPSGCG